RDFRKRSMIRSSDTSLSGRCIVARGRWRRACGGLVVAGVFAIPADAQGLPDLQRELREMPPHYDAELKRLRRYYETRIERLDKQAKAAQSTAARKAPSTVATAAPPPSPSLAPAPAEVPTNAGLEQPPAPVLPPPGSPAPGGLASLASAFNPSI